MKNFDDLSMYDKETAVNALHVWFWVKRALILLGVIITLSIAGCPAYNVWQQGMSGKAELKRAEQNRQITIEEAKALKESAKLKAEAEEIRAHGIKSANETIAEGLGGAEGYLRYLYIDALQNTSCNTIYIPTEAGLPILEANRHNSNNR